MPWEIWLFIVGYLVGWIGFVVVNDPRDSLDGAILIYCGMIWPLFALGWLVSR
jgi:hypothetical protein